MAVVVTVTVAIEVVQLWTGRGLLEVSDVVGNVVGGALGVCFVWLPRRALGRRSGS